MLIPSTEVPRWQRVLAGAGAVIVGIALTASGMACLFEAWRYANQEYLHWWSSDIRVEPLDPRAHLWGSYALGALFWICGPILVVIGLREIVVSRRRGTSTPQ